MLMPKDFMICSVKLAGNFLIVQTDFNFDSRFALPFIEYFFVTDFDKQVLETCSGRVTIERRKKKKQPKFSFRQTLVLMHHHSHDSNKNNSIMLLTNSILLSKLELFVHTFVIFVVVSALNLMWFKSWPVKCMTKSKCFPQTIFLHDSRVEWIIYALRVSKKKKTKRVISSVIYTTM